MALTNLFRDRGTIVVGLRRGTANLLNEYRNLFLN
jgi:hypothetical protein